MCRTHPHWYPLYSFHPTGYYQSWLPSYCEVVWDIALCKPCNSVTFTNSPGNSTLRIQLRFCRAVNMCPSCLNNTFSPLLHYVNHQKSMSAEMSQVYSKNGHGETAVSASNREHPIKLATVYMKDMSKTVCQQFMDTAQFRGQWCIELYLMQTVRLLYFDLTFTVKANCVSITIIDQ